MDILEGLSYIHSRHLIHGRLTSSNCLVDQRLTIKITGRLSAEIKFPIGSSTHLVCSRLWARWPPTEIDQHPFVRSIRGSLQTSLLRTGVDLDQWTEANTTDWHLFLRHHPERNRHSIGTLRSEYSVIIFKRRSIPLEWWRGRHHATWLSS